MMQLRVNGSQEQLWSLRKSAYSIGSSTACDLYLAEASVEPVHAQLKVTENSVYLVRRGDAVVKVNGVLVPKKSSLSHGDRIHLGDVEMEVVDTERQREQEEQTDADDHGDLDEPIVSDSGYAPGESEPEEEEQEEQEESEADQPTPGWVLYGINALSKKSYPVDGTLLVGRASDCDIRLSEAHLSRQHARLTATAQTLEVEDLHSANGTYVNGKRVSSAQLESGDELSFDSLRFRIVHTANKYDPDETSLRPPVMYARKPALPTAIEVQRANLRRLREEGLGYRATESTSSPGTGIMVTNGPVLVMAFVALAMLIWGASALFR